MDKEKQADNKQPFYKKWWFVVVAAIVVFGYINSSSDEDQNEVAEVSSEKTDQSLANDDNEPDDSDETADEEVNGDEEDWDDLKDKSKIVGKSDKDFTELTNSKPTNVRNDKTGKWRKITLSENVNIEEYALSYSKTHMKEDEVHYIVNFQNNTTTWLNKLGGLLYVDVRERIDKEEHDAAKLGSGMTLKSYVIYPDGDIEEIE